MCMYVLIGSCVPLSLMKHVRICVCMYVYVYVSVCMNMHMWLHVESSVAPDPGIAGCPTLTPTTMASQPRPSSYWTISRRTARVQSLSATHPPGSMSWASLISTKSTPTSTSW